MKINGMIPQLDRETIIPCIGNQVRFYLIAQPICSYDGFEQLCTRPKPPVGGEPGKEAPNYTAKPYLEALAEYNTKLSDWMYVVSLVQVADEKGNRMPMEWSRVKLEDIETYKEWRDELQQENKLSVADVRRIENEVLRCNSMDDAMIEKAREDFLAMPVVTNQ